MNTNPHLTCWTIWTIIAVLHSVITVEAQKFHSIHRLHSAISLQADLAGKLEDYVKAEEARLDMIREHIEMLRDSDVTEGSYAARFANASHAKLQHEMSHPVRAFKLLSNLYNEANNISDAHNLSDFVSPHHNFEVFQKLVLDTIPSRKDFVEAASAIARLQAVYGDTVDFTQPTEDNPTDFFTALELFEVAKLHMEETNFSSALNNLIKVIQMFEAAGDVVWSMAAKDYMAYIMSQQGNPSQALKILLELIPYYEKTDSERAFHLEATKKMHMDYLGLTEPELESFRNVTTEYANFNSIYYDERYIDLCQGKSVQTNASEMKPLKCYLTTNNNHPLLLLSPAKVEEFHSSTGLSFYHDVLTDGEIKLLQKLANGDIADSSLTAGQDVRESNVELIDDFSFDDKRIRSSNTGWVGDELSETIENLSRRISATLNLSLDSSEPFQVLSYGVGGFYQPHFDWGTEDPPFPNFDGNRIATWIFYLNDIPKGGATVFPEIGVTVWPKKGGAAYWNNLYRNGTGHELTLHAACPVLEGYKWVSNKWFHTVGNEFSQPCSLDSAA